MSIRSVAPLFVAALVIFGTVTTAQADEAQYKEWLQKRDRYASLVASAKGDTYAMIDMGDCYVRPDPWCGQDITAGTNLWLKAVAKGEYWLLERLIMALAEGEGVSQFSPWQLRWDPLCNVAGLVREKFQEHAISGKAKSYLGLCFLAGRLGVLKKDTLYGTELLDWAASNDHQVDAAAILSDIFHYGRYGIAINVPKSEYYARLAAINREIAEADGRIQTQAANREQAPSLDSIQAVASREQLPSSAPAQTVDDWGANRPTLK
ncbi:MAG: hypothetical protein HQL64_09965 [Magnetococcales bacterium]|nr:hypothetical protein [Magnetococcales bacterium]